MRLKEIYELAIEVGIEADPRSRKDIDKLLSRNKEDYEKLSGEEKTFYDLEKLSNPYADTRILAGNPEQKIRGILAGVDIEGPEILLADRLNEKGGEIDLVMAHHPEGRALAALSDVMGMQADIWHRFGVPINVGDVLISKRAKEVQRALSPLNHNRAVDVAQALGIALMCVHTPADNLVSSFLQKEFDQNTPYLVDDVTKYLLSIPEYQEAAKIGAGPTLVVGEKNRRAGKILVMMTGGTGGPEESIEKLAAAGVGTIVEMHMEEKLRKKAEENHLNVIIAGHIASDSLGFNLWLDRLEEKGVSIQGCVGLTRVKRLGGD